MDRARVLLDINNAIVAHLDLKWSACGFGVRPSPPARRANTNVTCARAVESPGLGLRRQTFHLCECIKEDKMATLRAIRNNEPTTNASAARVDMKLEVVVIPVSDVDR